jgi:hypothetical protein
MVTGHEPQSSEVFFEMSFKDPWCVCMPEYFGWEFTNRIEERISTQYLVDGPFGASNRSAKVDFVPKHLTYLE